MAVRQSKQALADAAALLRTDTEAARVFLREVQSCAGPIPYATIVAAMRAANRADVQVVAPVAVDMVGQPSGSAPADHPTDRRDAGASD